MSEYVYLLYDFVKAFSGEVKICGSFTQKVFKKWVPCHYSMAHPQVADRGDDLQILRVAVTILNN
jgi:hypothetical protein